MPDDGKQLIKYIARIFAMWAITALALIIIAHYFPHRLYIEYISTALVAAAVIGLLNALIWPIFIRVALPIAIYTFGLFILILNGIIIYIASAFVPGFYIPSVGSAILVTLGVTAITTICAGILSIDQDDDWWSRIVQRRIRKIKETVETDVPGIFFLEIDGLAEPVLRRALQDGKMPTLKRWLDTGSHKLTHWETDLSSQTSSSQAGILHGDNSNIPAYTYYKKSEKKMISSGNPKTTALMEKERSNGNGLLVQNGASRINFFSGDAPSVMLTTSTIFDKSRRHAREFYAYFLNPYNFSRTVVLYLWDVLVELRYGLSQWLRNEQPRVSRGGPYPLMRAVMTAFLPDVGVATLIGDMYGGTSSAYTTFGSYDEVAHHSGHDRKDALNILKRLDHYFLRLERASRRASRPYHFVILSDHGQTTGATFKQRYDMTLEDFVKSLISDELSVETAKSATDAWVQFNDLLNDAVSNENKRTARSARWAAKGRTYDGTITIGPDRDLICKTCEEPGEGAKSNVVITTSGNLGLIYFADWVERLTIEEINKRFPNLLPGLTKHPGIGFVMVNSTEQGPLVIGANGMYFLSTNHIEGDNPLASFGPNAAKHLLRESSFQDCPDILVSSFYKPETNEIAAFEELVGSHGGLGGSQTRPFILYPASLNVPEEPIIGAASVHQIFKGWVASLNQDRSQDLKPTKKVPDITSNVDSI
jgi:putative membrane protein